MNFFDIILFIAKYIPFWAVPFGLISLHFAYTFWLKDYRDIAYFWVGITLFCLTAVAIYFVMGGPNGIVKNLTQVFS
ncbi:MAG: hypothetical protein H7336_13020 [Bacteriovorax sp.]|nr:hypothetical protein [Bacteriovorax sp.]